jgi:hypothetical protein
MKFIAYFLPQYHYVKENDEWWGRGFTEWTNVKKARPLFRGHYQPHKPKDDNYYVLTEKSTVEYQTDLMDKYNVYGLAYYHYWFNGKLLLEKPAENLLKWKDINQRFFFFWANHTWIKSVNGVKTVLQEQTYSGEKDWQSHFKYFLPFFKDDRYIKVNNKPVIAIYVPEDIPQYNDMIRLWDELAIENGFNGVYIIESINGYHQFGRKSIADAEMLRAPNLGTYDITRWYGRIAKRPRLQKKVPFFFPYKIPYKKVITSLIKESKKYKTNKKVYFGTYCGWDNTCRHGRYGSVHTNINAEDFRRSIMELKKLTKEDDFFFINAWNEWAEGMHLEPDEKNGFSFLEVLKDIK